MTAYRRHNDLIVLPLVVLCISLGPSFCLAQGPPTPQFKTFAPMQPDKGPAHYQDRPVAPSIVNHSQRSALQTAPAGQRTYTTNTHTLADPLAIYNQLNSNNSTLTPSSTIPSISRSSMQMVTDILKEVGWRQNTVRYDFPTLADAPDHGKFQEAFAELSDMLDGKTPQDLKRAAFLTENAFLGGQMDFEGFSRSLEEMVDLVHLKMHQEGLSAKDNDALLYMAFKYFTDTLDIQMPFQEQTVQTYPKTYDFEDPFGYGDPTNLFITKLMLDNSGQCKSLPLLFMVLLQELGAEAYLSFSPSHSFVKCRDKHGVWYNIELTNGMLTSDSWVVGSGYVKSEAIRSGIFLDTLNTERIIANCLVDLAQYYSWKYGAMDSFMLQCVDKALQHHPNNIWAVQVKSDYFTMLFEYVKQQKGYSSMEDLKNDPQAMELFMQRNRLYALADGLGYQPMPQQAYEDWLNTLEQKQQEQAHQDRLIKFSKTVR